MFICQIIASHGNGGLEKHVRDLSQCLVEQGHRVLVIGGARFTKTLPNDVEYVNLNMQLSRHNPWLLFQLYQCLREHDVDVIHAQANKAASLLSRLRWLLKIPTVATIHNIKNNVDVFHRFAHVIGVSQYLAKQMNHAGVEVIYNGIQVPNIQQVDLKAQYQLPAEKPVLCAVGRLVPAKGFDVLLGAIDGLPVSLIIVGEGPQRARLEKRIATMSSNTVVHLIGHHDNPAALMHAADGLVIASRREGFSYVLNEALMSGVNVLSTDVPVANEVLPRALIVPADNAQALREKLVALLQDSNRWTTLMQTAQQFAEQAMTVQQMTKKTADLYQRMR